jgi:hypothetical protein
VLNNRCQSGLCTYTPCPGPRQSSLPFLTVGLLNGAEAKSVARASARAKWQLNHFRDFDGALVPGVIPIEKGELVLNGTYV